MFLQDNLQETKWSVMAADMPTRILSANQAEQAPPIFNASLSSVIQKYVPYSEGDQVKYDQSNSGSVHSMSSEEIKKSERARPTSVAPESNSCSKALASVGS